MRPDAPIEQVDKLTRIYSERRERQILLRLQYSMQEEAGCKIYSLQKVDELE